MSIPLADCAIYGFITLCLKEREETEQGGRGGGGITGPGPPHLKNKKIAKAKKRKSRKAGEEEGEEWRPAAPLDSFMFPGAGLLFLRGKVGGGLQGETNAISRHIVLTRTNVINL